ncbi:MAG TPA: DoxX family protein, partial [Xanthobacteraceae bacterium]|nr:DoxX family protein [Xanthobacteraceae bacterium]
MIDRIAPGWGDVILLLGRILIGGIFVQSGFDKLMGLDAFAAGLAARGLPAALVPVLAPIGASVEFFGGLAIVFGLMTRHAALLMIAFVIVATLISHRFWCFRARSDAPRRCSLPRTWRSSAASYSSSSPAAAIAWIGGGAAA